MVGNLVIGAVESFTTTEMRLSWSLVTAKKRVALAENLLVSRVDFLLRVREFGCSLLDGLPYPTEPLGRDPQAELSLGVVAVGAGTQSSWLCLVN